MRRMIQASLYSHDERRFTAEEVLEKALNCQREGASLVHVHRYKLGSDEEFFKFVRMLEEHNGPALNLSVSDFDCFCRKDDGITKSIRSAAIHGCDCTVFGHSVSQSYEGLVEDLQKCLWKGLIPEICIFNKLGADYCARLNKVYKDKFYVGVYLDYPLELAGTEENILAILEILKSVKRKVFALYNNNENEIIKFILRNGGDIRVGEEDSAYCNGHASHDTVEMVKNAAVVIRECGFEVENHFE